MTRPVECVAVDFGGTIATGGEVTPAAVNVLHELGRRGVRLVLATNVAAERDRMPALRSAGVAGLFAAVVQSYAVGVAKPDPRFYQQVLLHAGCDPGQVLFVGNNLDHDVIGPLAAGMRAVLFRSGALGAGDVPAGALQIGELAELLDLVDGRADDVGATELTVATVNLETGGWDGHHGQHYRLDLLPELVAQVPEVDVLLLQEGKEYGFRGQRLRFHAERLLSGFGLRSFMTRSTRGELHEVVFVRWPRLRPTAHYTPDLPGVFHDQIGWLRFQVDGLEGEVAIRSVQWASWNGDIRLDEAQKLTRYAAPGVAAIIGGDFNSLWPDCPGHQEFEPDWEALPPHKRLHKTLPPGLRPAGRLVSDRRALTVLAEAGFVNAGCLARDPTPTVHGTVDYGQGARIDHIVLSPSLAGALVPGSYRVWTGEPGERVSDHRMVSVRLDLDRLSKPGRLPP
ncbi:hypothetical protein Sme01_62620 [Sphaerisporangium melleum]|uniref:Endonuclease/exonuclease/phosphatase domain-containing protein n=1 Tax=Sphaerisporangium melleum TaxID=321316 RepID=A0A917R0D9_9ACTN|nr:HAD family hydrolase [Sphaerisporangium melleum]GGK81916.1 hypothetical protein GCM10007964_25720 [Sphaerisporangium melleum]GII73786.1 hypothetical protein Sme01_62620 [Sphaerisporangium melleum]